MGIGEGYGENRVATAAHNAINSPLMEVPMIGAKRVLFNVTGGSKIGIHEIDEAARIINNASDKDVNLIWGQVFDPDMEDMVRITIIATDFDEAAIELAMHQPSLERAPAASDTPPPARVLSKPVRVSITDTAVESGTPVPTPARTAPQATAVTLRPRQEMGESEVRLSASPEEENLFNTQGLPQDQLDIPAYVRRKKKP
jgi:cell division protein FtsZ